MKSKPQSPLWPYLGILACLFVLSVTAPRAWQRMSRQETLSQILAARKSRPSVRPAAEPTYETIDGEELQARRSPGRSESVALPPTKPNPPVVEPSAVPPAPEFAQEVPSPIQTEAALPPELAGQSDAPAEPAGDENGAEPAIVENRWPLPRVLLEQLSEVYQSDPAATWAHTAIESIHELCRVGATDGRSPSDILANLRKLSAQSAADGEVGGPREVQLVRARYALTRWLDIWGPATSLGETKTADAIAPSSTATMSRLVAEAKAALTAGSPGTAWQKYLQLDALGRLANRSTDATPEERRALARRVLDRFASPSLTRAQRKFVAEGALGKLHNELHAWAAEPIGAKRLLAHLDEYEHSSRPSDARRVADDWRGLRWSAGEPAEEISRHVETHYRNANVRIALSGDFLNRLVPPPRTIESAVRDTVVDVPVVGRSTTFTEVFVRLVPDARRIRIGLEANGLVSSNTFSTSGPATFHNNGQSTFLVRKLLVLGPDGLTVWPALAEADNAYNNLVSMETGFDGVPLVGSLVRGIARSQHDELRQQARMQVEQKVATRALDQFDAEVRPRLVKAAEKIQNTQVATLNRLGLELVPVGLSTTAERAIARVRLAGPEQLGAHTPRPRAPSDSWASLQVHQSALNNGLESLDLDGRTFTLDELFAWIAKKLNRPDLAKQEDLPQDVRMTFAETDAVRVRCEDDRIEVMFAFAELTQGGSRWRNFTVHSFYQPEAQGLNPRFVRDKGTISLEGKSLKRKIALRVIFSKVLSINRDLSFLDKSVTSDPRFTDLEITQFVVERGWIALAYSAKRTPPSVVRRPK